ncbi:hypothetical protein A1Q1_00187 [Trichosporon asahii var. asahii CBS 2479]|uniref:Uncharacterized protein n=1 Tax=Trichosporon asahii var. asahii (strain ATCC 90039 / CBS 2479 / JCM 2466 / KCTC 7840 / NBRC 103889/ NCYC 2677 / UAMH 7654) TaxID=1186058 RepID=J6F0Q1_TRIAS|nr:hypothetical protein A1Q1_00187 [Trichosporon asahii var. asahii CBS 2479]EJT50489.1 hypothetical protein A1Q1_00187 [Trichosporon asahii var. asahii CBS 2479]
MSHSHGGGCCDHDHGPQTTGMGGPPGGGGGGPPQMNIQIDERMQLLLDSLPTRNVPFTLVDVPLPGSQPPQTQQMVVCAEHKAPVCETCSVNFTPLNYMHQFMRSAPPEAIPPPPQVQPPPHRAEAIKQAKEAGNGNIPGAIQNYSRSADMALSRPPWELAAISRDETAIALCNRSAAFAAAGALRARALAGMGRLEEARQAIVDGLQFEPDEKELNDVLREIDHQIEMVENGTFEPEVAVKEEQVKTEAKPAVKEEVKEEKA